MLQYTIEFEIPINQAPSERCLKSGSTFDQPFEVGGSARLQDEPWTPHVAVIPHGLFCPMDLEASWITSPFIVPSSQRQSPPARTALNAHVLSQRVCSQSKQSQPRCMRLLAAGFFTWALQVIDCSRESITPENHHSLANTVSQETDTNDYDNDADTTLERRTVCIPAELAAQQSEAPKVCGEKIKKQWL
jgi:hypothetical protein